MIPTRHLDVPEARAEGSAKARRTLGCPGALAVWIWLPATKAGQKRPEIDALLGEPVRFDGDAARLIRQIVARADGGPTADDGAYLALAREHA
jgi:hypothetical protein